MGLRQERLADQIRDLIASSMSGGKMGDPRLQLIAITAVKLTGDLQEATVFFRMMDDSVSEKEALAGFKSASGFFRTILAKALDIRRAPILKFRFDKSIEQGSRIEKLIQTIHEE